jgi:membrane dipeptidase
MSPAPTLSPRTLALVARRPVFDAHVDSLQRQLDLEHDLGLRTQGHLDLVRGAEGGLGSMVFVNWVDPKYIAPALGGARQRTRELLREFHRLLRAHPEEVAFAGNGRMLRAARAGGLLAGIPGIEGGHSIEESLDELVWFFERGVRVLTLVWNNHLTWIRSCQSGAGPEVPEGLSEFGRSVVRTMNELGMVVDVSHAGEKSFYDALETTSKPVIASHSGCKALHAHPRNLTDEQLRALKRNGGVVGIVFCVPFLSQAGWDEDARWRESEGYKALAGRNATELFLRQGEYLQEKAEPLPIEVLVEHVEHAVEVAGIEHVGLGSDFDGILRTPQGLEDASCYGNLVEKLLERGFGEDDVLRICGGNMERVFAQATGAGTRADTAELLPYE